MDDPYTFDSGQGETVSMPEVEYLDIYDFLKSTPSPYTKEEQKAYKSLDGYKYLVAGWVGNISVHTVAPDNKKVSLAASVRHSQSVTATPLKPWVAAERCGNIVCIHCTCVAGLGEACSYISAMLFSAEAYTKYIKSVSCTSDSCTWLPPSLQKVMHQFLI